MPISGKCCKNIVLASVVVLPIAVWFAARQGVAKESKHILAQMRRNMVYVPPARVVLGSRERGSAAAPFETECGGFWLGRYETTVQEFACYLNDAQIAEAPACLDLVRGARGWRPRRGRARWPVTHVSYEEARRFCEWLSGKWQRRVRLPTETEWEYAARGGVHGARFPWGWGDPKGRARFCAESPCRIGRYDPNPFGLYDMAGNVYEWCAGFSESNAVARGGSWAERDFAALRVFARAIFSQNYRDRDVGFRILMEAEKSIQDTSLP